MGEEDAKKINFLSSKKDKLSAVKSTISFKPSSSLAPTKLLGSASSSFQVWKNPLGKKSHADFPKTCYAEASSSKINIVENPILDQAKKNIINVSFANPDAAGVNLINTNQNRESRAGKSICLDHNLGKTGEDPKILKRYLYMDGIVCIYTKLYIFGLHIFIFLFKFLGFNNIWLFVYVGSQIELMQRNTDCRKLTTLSIWKKQKEI